MCLPAQLERGSSVLLAPVWFAHKLKHPELARRLDITPHEGHAIGAVKQSDKLAVLLPAGAKVAKQVQRSNVEAVSPPVSNVHD